MADAETSAGQGSVIDAKRFRMIELVTLEDLLEHPVWADFQGDRDRTRILSWGVSEACLEDAIERYDYCGRSPLYPVLELENTEDFSNPTIALRIALPGGGFATGYRMGDLAVEGSLSVGDVDDRENDQQVPDLVELGGVYRHTVGSGC